MPKDRITARLNAFHKALYNVIFVVAGVTVVTMLAHVVVDVFFREIVGFQIFATIEMVSNYYMVAVTYLCIALAQIGGDHIEMSMVMSLQKKPVQKLAMVLGAILAVIAYGFLAVVSAADALEKTEFGAYALVGAGRLPIWPSYWILPIGFTAMVLVTITTSYLRFRNGLDYQTIPVAVE